MKRFLVQLYIAWLEVKKNLKLTDSPAFLQSRLEADIIRYVHSIEKGLCICEPRKGFGIAKIEKMLSLSEIYIEKAFEDQTCLYFVRDVLKCYFAWNNERGYDSAELQKVKARFEKLFENLKPTEDVYGGMTTVRLSDLDYDEQQIEKFIYTRHSVREFSGESVTDAEIQKAVALAQRSPSACNRQGFRVYAVSSKKYIEEIGNSLEGIGGFADDVDKFLLITAKQSAYNLSEKNQYVVTAAMFAGYLTLALHAYRIAACVVQRSLVPNKVWDTFCSKNSIPKDEQIVLMIGIGKYKEETKVPVSKRFDIDYIYRNLDEK